MPAEIQRIRVVTGAKVEEMVKKHRGNRSHASKDQKSYYERVGRV